MVKCTCGYESSLDGFGMLRDPWRFYTVRMLECPRCRKVFNYYHGVSPRSGKVSEFVIRRRTGPIEGGI